MNSTEIVMVAATAFFLAVTLLPLSHNQHWSIRGLDFPRMQFAVVGMLILLANCLLLNPTEPLAIALILATSGCLCYQAWWILPYSPLWRKEVLSAGSVPDSRRLRVLTANVLTPNREAHKLLALVREHKPDVLVALETDDWWEQQLDTLEDEMPFAIKCPLDNLYGMHVYSRLALTDVHVEYLVEPEVPSMHALLTLPCGDSIRVHFLHPAPPSPTENAESAERDAELIIVARSVANSDLPVVVTGDLNDVAWSDTTRLFRKLSGLLDPRVGRGMYNTFHADYPLVRWPLDHLFHSDHFSLLSITRLPPIGSDHFALLTELALTPAKQDDHSGLEADSDDKQQGREITENMEVSAKQVPTPGES